MHGSDGLDEITTVGPDRASRRWRTARCAPSRSRPEDVGLARAKPEALRGGDAEQNAAALRDVLKGKNERVPRHRGPQCGRRRWSSPARAKDLKEGVALARQVARFRRGRRPRSTG